MFLRHFALTFNRAEPATKAVARWVAPPSILANQLRLLLERPTAGKKSALPRSGPVGSKKTNNATVAAKSQARSHGVAPASPVPTGTTTAPQPAPLIRQVGSKKSAAGAASAPVLPSAAASNVTLETRSDEEKPIKSFVSASPVACHDFLLPSRAVSAEQAWAGIVAEFNSDKGAKRCLLRGGCQTGKTSLVGCGQYLSTVKGSVLEGKKVVSMMLIAEVESSTGGKVKHKVVIPPGLDELLQDPNAILVFDEAQVWFGCHPTDSAEGKIVMKVLKTPVECAALFLTTSSQEVTRTKGFAPAELEPRQLWFTGPTTDPVEVERYIRNALTDPSIPANVVNVASKTLFALCGCNIGLVSSALRIIQTNKGFKTFDLFLGNRALMGGNGKLKPRQEEFLTELLAVGTLSIDMKVDDDIKDLARLGYLVPAMVLEADSPTHKITHTSTHFTFSNALQAERLRGLLPCRRVLTDTTFTSGIDLVFFVLPAMPSWAFVAAASDANSTAVLLESSLQHGMSTAAAAMGIQPHVEVTSRIEGKPGRPHAVDFMFNTTRIVDGACAIELLSDHATNAASLAKHVAFFGEDGQHQQYADRCVVVSFYSHATQLPTLENSDIPIMAVAPHPRAGWSTLVVRFIERGMTKASQINIARHGLPVDRAGKVLSKYVPVAAGPCYVRVTLPGEQQVTTDVAATLRKEDLPRTVDGLKEAVLKKLPVMLKHKDIASLKVFPPGKEKGEVAYDKMSTPLGEALEEVPYHVMVT